MQCCNLAVCSSPCDGCAQVTLVTKGLVDREAKLRKATEDLWQQVVAAQQELTCFRALATNEVASMPTMHSQRHLVVQTAALRCMER